MCSCCSCCYGWRCTHLKASPARMSFAFHPKPQLSNFLPHLKLIASDSARTLSPNLPSLFLGTQKQAKPQTQSKPLAQTCPTPRGTLPLPLPPTPTNGRPLECSKRQHKTIHLLVLSIPNRATASQPLEPTFRLAKTLAFIVEATLFFFFIISLAWHSPFSFCSFYFFPFYFLAVPLAEFLARGLIFGA